ncbi:MAG: GntR family transcriptional regulator [Caldilinea sp.]|uniref:GntR family transcriptional regulator n=1 Tax=Caldilinea sp. TaxID=2293560 RepID=UPI002C6F8BE0|nr:GntR family transcriptional regulator [Anaerolineales bacterium]HQY93420.1 GntR family transcriptional regulator [Caldilinea sp.]
MLTRDQIADQLRKRIERGDLKPDSALPPERLLAEDLGVSRMTVRVAIDQLAEEGLLVRRPNRRTLVAGDKISRSASFMSFSEEMRARGWRPHSVMRQSTATVADVPVAAQLNLEIGAKVIYLERLRFADGEPLALERVHLPYARFAPLLSLDLTNQSLYTVMEEALGVRPVLAEESVEAVLLSTQEAEIFGTTAGSPALLTRRITRDEEGYVIEAATSLYRGDRYRMALVRRR